MHKKLGIVFTTLTTIASATPWFLDARGENTSSSAFVHKTKSGSLAFSLVAVQETGDFMFHLEAPAEYSWIAVGTGEKMDGSLMWIAYRSRNGTGVTLSPRSVNDHVEPTFDERIDCQIFTGNGTANGVIKVNNRDILVVNGVCTNMIKSDADDGEGNIDFTSTHQNFIFALGPTGKSIQSDSKSAGIRRHTLYGQFSMDLSKATAADTETINQVHLSSVGNWESSNAQLVGDITNDSDWAGPVHAVLMGGTFVILFPIGVVFLRLLERVKWHAWMQGVGMVFAVLGLGAGIYLGREYNHSKAINSTHQIIGLIVILFVLVQFGLGMFHHRLYRRHQQPTIFGRIHLYLGPLVLILGVVNGFLGFNFADEDDDNIWYGAIVGVVFLMLVGALVWARQRRKVKSVGLERDYPLETGSYVQVEHPREARESVPLRDIRNE